MRIGELDYSVMFYGALVLAGIALLVVIGMIEGNRTRGVPSARVVNAPVDADVVVAKARPILRIAAAIGVLIAAVVAAYWLHHHRVDLVVIADDSSNSGGGGAHAKRYIQFSAPDGMPLAHPQNADDLFTDGQVWVLNESHQTARLEDVSYGISIGFGSEPKLVPPGTMDHTHSIEYIGPGDVPPKSVEVTSGLNFDVRTWLTWDR